MIIATADGDIQQYFKAENMLISKARKQSDLEQMGLLQAGKRDERHHFLLPHRNSTPSCHLASYVQQGVIKSSSDITTKLCNFP